MVPDWITEGADRLGEWRCVICGARLDPTIVKNRIEQFGKVHHDRTRPGGAFHGGNIKNRR